MSTFVCVFESFLGWIDFFFGFCIYLSISTLTCVLFIFRSFYRSSVYVFMHLSLLLTCVCLWLSSIKESLDRRRRRSARTSTVNSSSRRRETKASSRTQLVSFLSSHHHHHQTYLLTLLLLLLLPLSGVVLDIVSVSFYTTDV